MPRQNLGDRPVSATLIDFQDDPVAYCELLRFFTFLLPRNDASYVSPDSARTCQIPPVPFSTTPVLRVNCYPRFASRPTRGVLQRALL